MDLPDCGITGIYARLVDVVDNFDARHRAAAAVRLKALTEILASVDTLVSTVPDPT